MVSLGEIDSKMNEIQKALTTCVFCVSRVYTNIVGSYVSRVANVAGAKYTQSP